MYGIDISEHNGNINLEPYKGQFVIIRAGYGRTYTDKKFVRNVEECTRLGIPFGIYWYSYALNPEHARAEAEKCLATIKPYKDRIRVGVWFDMEDADHYKAKNGFRFNVNTVSALCNAFCEVVEKAGYYVGIYTSQSWLGTYVSCPKYDKWVANWGINNGKVNVDTRKLGSMLQYTSKPLDKDLIYVDLVHYEMNKTFIGTLPMKFPKRGYFAIGDGYNKNISFKTQIRRAQKYCNWMLNAGLEIDGCYGPLTKAAVLEVQKKLGMEGTHGNWGPRTQALAKDYKKGA